MTITITALTDQPPVIDQPPDPHLQYCERTHADGEPCTIEPFSVPTTSEELLIGVTRVTGAEPLITLAVMPANGDEAAVTVLFKFTLADAKVLWDALFEMACLSGSCDCNDGELCPSSPDFVGDPR